MGRGGLYKFQVADSRRNEVEMGDLMNTPDLGILVNDDNCGNLLGIVA